MTDPINQSQSLANAPQEGSRELEVPERLVQTFLAQNLDLLGIASLDLLGMEYQVPSGRIDILARSPTNRLIAIEIKRGIATRDAVGQLQSYVGDLLVQERTELVSGLLIAAGLDSPAKSALIATPSIEFWSYRTLFTFSRVTIERPTSLSFGQGLTAEDARVRQVSCPYCGTRGQFDVLREDGRTFCRKCGSFLTVA